MYNLRIILLSILLIVSLAVIVFIVIKLKYLLVKILLISLTILIFFISGKIVNLNTLSTKEYNKLSKVWDKCDEEYIDVKGKSIYVKINGKYVDINEIQVICIFSKDYTVSVDGVEIELQSPGIKNTVKALYDIGLLE